MARSDIWRFRRYPDKARDLAHVTAGISSHFGSAARDRSYRVTWGPIADTYGGTDTKGHRVILNPALLDKLSPEAPFTGEAVDYMQGVAGHEAGHAVFAEHHGRHAQDGLVGNIVEDMLIDGGAFGQYNPGLAAETKALREGLASEFLPAIEEHWRAAPGRISSGAVLVNLWGCARLFGRRLPVLDNRQHERPYMARLDAVADVLFNVKDFTGSIAGSAYGAAVAEIQAVQFEYDKEQRENPEPEPEPQDKGDEGEQDAEQSEQSDEGEQGEQGEDEGDSTPGTGKGKGTKGDPGEDTEDADGAGAGSGDDGDEDSDDEAADGGADDGSDESESSDAASGTAPGQSDGAGEDGDPGEGDGDSTPTDEGGEGAGPGAGGAAKKTRADWDAALPAPCPRDDMDAPSAEATDPDFWKGVEQEIAAIDSTQSKVQGKVHMARFTDKGTVAAIKTTMGRLASEPARQRHHDSGRIDRRGLTRATMAEDVFTRNRERTLKGRVVLVLDFSGSVSGSESLLKSSAASVYEALTGTALDVWVYGYGNPTVSKLADPRKVSPAFANLNAGGGTPTAEALACVLREVIARPGESNLIVHVTDGAPGNPVGAIQQMARARKSGWKVINVGIRTSRLPFAEVSDSQQYLQDYRQLPKLLERALGDLVTSQKNRARVGV